MEPVHTSPPLLHIGFVREFAPKIQDLEAVEISFRDTTFLPLTMQTTSLCPWEGGALCVREIRLLPLPEGAASATPPAGRGAERGRFLSWPGGLRRRLSARRYRVPPAAAEAGAGRTEPGQAGPGRAGPQGREAPSGLPAGASRRHGDAGRPERRIPAGRPSRTARGVSARTRAALRPPPTLAAGAAALPSALCPPGRREAGLSPVDAGLSPGGARPCALRGQLCRVPLLTCGCQQDPPLTQTPKSQGSQGRPGGTARGPRRLLAMEPVAELAWRGTSGIGANLPC